MNEGERYRRAKAIFLEAQERDPAECAAFVAAACGDDAALRAEVDALLADGRTWGATLDRLDESAAPTLPPEYHALRELGRGGMGVVWLAERDTGEFRQRVALKLLGASALRDPEQRARFRAERRILASLDHPHIARLLDGGTLADGTPFLAMEYVEGERLDAWCARVQPPLRELLRVVVAVCRAMQAAQQRLIVHRDLKPANILVDAYGAPKLLDFGIAKLLDDDSDANVATGTGMHLLTPRYAAPEQVRGDAVTTATDVYALGVILYELLTGASPYGSVTTAPEQLRAVCDTDPIRPSAAARGDTPARTQAARLRGDLDAIVLKCLRKNPVARYRGAAELADDLEAFLDGRPVAARAGSRRYALGKFVSRHRYLVASVGAVLVVLAVAGTLLLRQLGETRTQRDRAAQERDKAEQVTGFLVDLLRNADPERAKGEQVTVRQALDRGEAELTPRLRDHPETKAFLYRQLALIRTALGDAAHGVKLAQQAQTLLATVPQVPASERDETRLAHAQALIDAGRVDEAAPALREIETAAAARGDDLLRSKALTLLARVPRAKLDFAATKPLQAQARAVLLHALGIAGLDAAPALARDEARRAQLTQLATLAQDECNTLTEARETDNAWTTCNQTLALLQALWPPDHPQQLAVRSTLATLAFMRGDKPQALSTQRELVAAMRKVYGDEHLLTARAMRALGVFLRDAGDYAEAETMYQTALATLRKRLGPTHRYIFVVQTNLANLLIDQGRVEQSRALHAEVLAQRRKVFGERHTDVAISLMNLAEPETRLGRHDDAIAHSAQALAMYTELLGPQHHDTVQAMKELAWHQFSGGRHAEAERNARTALRAYEAMHEAQDERGALRFLLARIEWATGQREQAITDARQALEEAQRYGGNDFRPQEVEAWLAAHALPAR